MRTLSSETRDTRNDGVSVQPATGCCCTEPDGSDVASDRWPADAATAVSRTAATAARKAFMGLVGDDDRVAGVEENGRTAVNGVLVVEADRLSALARLADDLDVLRVGEVFQPACERQRLEHRQLIVLQRDGAGMVHLAG